MFFYNVVCLHLPQPTVFIHIFQITIVIMIFCKPTGKRLTILALILFLSTSINSVSAQDGKALFMSKCAACHSLDKDMTGPALRGIIDKAPYNGDMAKMSHWIRNVNKLVATDPHYMDLKAKFGGSVMIQFDESALPEPELEAIIKYTSTPVATPTPGGGGGGVTEPQGNNNVLIFGIITLILAVIALILMQVNSNLKKMSDDAEGISRPNPVPFYKNKAYIAIFILLASTIFGYLVAKGAIGLGRQKNYQPVQPIFYSHKVHAGINQINCLYCHGSAWESKTAGIPSVNICMNCHKAVTDYTKGPKLYTEDGKEVDGTAEIAKLYKAAGFDPKSPASWDPTKANSIEWVKIHNLPDHVYFNHSQHVNAGNVQCQTCHGDITAMDEVKQVSELSMGWCVNCHRNTNVNFNYDSTKGNKFYSIYEKFHKDFKNKKMDSITVKDIGGLECQKCHY